MKCINKKNQLCVLVTLVIAFVCACTPKDTSYVISYESENYNRSLYQSELFAEHLCVANENVSQINYKPDAELHAAALFGLNQEEVFYSDHIHDRVYPASTTKLFTLYTALKHGNLNDVVTVGSAAENVPWDSSKAGIQKGQKLTLEDLLYGLMLPSGNDSAAAIAEHISGSESAFVDLMNTEAKKLGATNSHFVNAHGYHDTDHYTTAYDLYLVLNEGIKNPEFVKIISSDSYTAKITNSDGSTVKKTWEQSNMYVNGSRKAPDKVTVIGGKTGTTSEAGACLVLFEKDTDGNPYISIIMGAPSKANLYDTMSALISTIPTIK